MKTIGQNIAGYRKEKGITQETLAEICSVTPQAVSKWENDVSYPDITLLKPLARAFGVSVDETKVTDVNMPVPAEQFVLHKGKKVHIKIVVK